MSIADELRKVARGNANKELYVVVEADRLFDIANRIDEAHKQRMRKKYTEGYNDGYDGSFASADDWDDDHADALAEHGWVKLPVDADGETIHIGDVMDTEHFGTVEVEGFVHNSIAFYNYSCQPAYLCTTPVSLCRHHHESTIADVLREFSDEVRRCCDTEDTINEYADRIREVLCDAQ